MRGSTPSDFEAVSHFVRAPGVLWRQVASVILVRTVTDPEILELSGTATLLWIALAEPITAHELATELASVVRAPLDRVAPDIHTALADLVHRGVVTQLKVAG